MPVQMTVNGQAVTIDAAPNTLLVQALLAAHPQATPFAPAQAGGSTPLDNGGIRLLYRTPLRDCHACADVGQIQIGYDFDGTRHFIGQQVVPVATP